MEQIMTYNQGGTVKDYCDTFQILFDQVRNLEEIPEFYAIYLFRCGLEPEIRKIFARWHQYSCTKVEDVISLALKIDSNDLQDSFSPFDPNSSFYNKDLEFDINITLKELMKDNEWFRNGNIQETCDNIVHETILDEVIDNNVLEENGYDNKAAFKVFDEMPCSFKNKLQEISNSEVSEIRKRFGNELLDSVDLEENETNQQPTREFDIHIDDNDDAVLVTQKESIVDNKESVGNKHDQRAGSYDVFVDENLVNRKNMIVSEYKSKMGEKIKMKIAKGHMWHRWKSKLLEEHRLITIDWPLENFMLGFIRRYYQQVYLRKRAINIILTNCCYNLFDEVLKFKNVLGTKIEGEYILTNIQVFDPGGKRVGNSRGSSGENVPDKHVMEIIVVVTSYVLVEKSLLRSKEYEFEGVGDLFDNVIFIRIIDNFDTRKTQMGNSVMEMFVEGKKMENGSGDDDTFDSEVQKLLESIHSDELSNQQKKQVPKCFIHVKSRIRNVSLVGFGYGMSEFGMWEWLKRKKASHVNFKFKSRLWKFDRWEWCKRKKKSGVDCKNEHRKWNFDNWRWPLRKKDELESCDKLVFC